MIAQRRRNFHSAEMKPLNDRETRRNTALEGFGILADGTTFALSIVNLSYTGCKVQSSIALLPRVTLKVSMLGLVGTLDAVVRWSKDGHAGLQFNPQDITERSQELRHKRRVAVSAELSLRRSGKRNYRARIYDLTTTGCKVEFVDRPAAGERLWAKFDGVDALEAEVRWIDGHRGGLEFVRSLHPAVFDLLVAKLSR